MSVNRKCLECNGCCDLIYTPTWVQYWHCPFCDLWFQNNAENVLSMVENPLVIKKEEGTNGEVAG